MKCPRCKTPDLKPTMIEEYLAGGGLSRLPGNPRVARVLPSLGRDSKAPTEGSAPETTISIETTDTTTALTCPKCSRVMMKYKLTGTVSIASTSAHCAMRRGWTGANGNCSRRCS